MKNFAHYLLTLCLISVAAQFGANTSEAKPNILWISCEDISPHLGCYGYEQANTPNLDRLASEGARYTHAFTVAGVCAVNRSATITGMYSTTLGTQHMRCTAKLPSHIRCFPEYLRDTGYYCTNNSKTDYNFSHSKETWDESSGKAHWKNRPDGKPFFAVFNLTMTHESRIAGDEAYEQAIAKLPTDALVDPSRLTLPPYYPDTEKTRTDWARYYNVIATMDRRVAELLDELKRAGLYEETIVFFWSDHGVGLPRAKRWLYDSGTRVPLIVRIPEKYRTENQGKSNSVSDELVSFIDLAPTVLNLAGAKIPEHMQGRAFLGAKLSAPREFVFGHRDRMDERYDIIRMVRDKRWKYIRNYESWKPYYQYMNTPEKGATMMELRRLHAEEKLPAAAELFMAESKPVEEFYDVEADPHELNNFAASQDAEHKRALGRLRLAHQQWTLDTKDTGLIPEPELVSREKQLGSRYAIMAEDSKLIHRIRKFATMSTVTDTPIEDLLSGLSERDAAVRYWAAINLGNMDNDSAKVVDALIKSTKDKSPIVRIAAARALCHLQQEKIAIPVLIRELKNDEPWTRLNAAIVLDEIDGKARIAIDDLKQARKDKENKYVVRVANRALNQLLGTSSPVP